MKTKIFILLLLLVGAAPLARAVQIDFASDDEQHTPAADLYAQGTDAIDDEDWPRAIDAFRRVVAMKGDRTEGALYWLAYAQAKSGRGAEGLETIAALERAYPKSRWISDAKALEIDIKQDAGQRVDPTKVDDEDLKLIAIQGLLARDPKDATPLLEKLISGHYSKRIKEQAMFVLSQSDSADAGRLLMSIARGTAHPELQTEAIKYLGIAGGKDLEVLGEVYQVTANPNIKREILKAYMVAGEEEPVVKAARGEKDANLRSEAVRLLGAMGAAHDLEQMYRSESSHDVKRTILESIAITDSPGVLASISHSETDPALRAEAVRLIGINGGSEAAKELVDAYTSGSDPAVRGAALEGLFVQGNARALVDLARREKDPKWKREIVSKLAVMDSKDAADYLNSLLDQ